MIYDFLNLDINCKNRTFFNGLRMKFLKSLAALGILFICGTPVLFTGCAGKGSPTSADPTGTPTSVPTITFTPAVTSTPTDSPTKTPSSTPSSTATITDTSTSTSSPTKTATVTSTGTPTQSPTVTDTPTQTPTATDTPTPCATQTPFGDTTVEPSNQIPSCLELNAYLASADANIISLTANFASTSGQYEMAVYSDTGDGKHPYNLLGDTGIQNVTFNGWNTAPLPSYVHIQAGNWYWIALAVGTGSPAPWDLYPSTGIYEGVQCGVVLGSLPNPFTGASGSGPGANSNGSQWSMYANICPAP